MSAFQLTTRDEPMIKTLAMSCSLTLLFQRSRHKTITADRHSRVLQTNVASFHIINFSINRPERICMTAIVPFLTAKSTPPFSFVNRFVLNNTLYKYDERSSSFVLLTGFPWW